MAYLPQSIEQIASIGANVSISANHMLPQSVEKIAAICKAKGGHLTLRDASKYLPQSLEKIAAIAKDHVTFVID